MTHELTLEYEKSTKNKHRYKEVKREGLPLILEQAYIPKFVLSSPPPTYIKITVELS